MIYFLSIKIVALVLFLGAQFSLQHRDISHSFDIRTAPVLLNHHSNHWLDPLDSYK